MMRYSIYLLAFIYLIAGCQEEKPTETLIMDHISYLASDELKGREAGTEEEKLAAEYVADQFSKIGLLPRGDENYYQDFEFLAGKNLENTYFKVGDTSLVSDEFKPLNFSGNGSAEGSPIDLKYGISASELNYDDYKGVDVSGEIVWISISSPDGIHPHSQYLNYHNLKERARLASSNGAQAVVFYNNDPTAEDPSVDYTENVSPLEIPVIFYQGKEIPEDNVSLSVNLVEDRRTARNVIGYINNQAENDIIIGAHFDHLGYGKSGGSLYRGEDPMIHNGADDNASGTALLIEMAKEINSSDQLKNHNFLFIAFSGEEKGLLGANYFTENPTIDLEKVSYMINMDMVGRLDSADHQLAINGVGTSPAWTPVIEAINTEYFDISTSDSGVGPSDHTSFYLADIPVLHFFTGTHEDYHKPSDDYEKINIEGMMEVKNFIMEINYSLNDSAQITFTKTQDAQSRTAPSFSVTLGVVPDYMYSNGGLKIDGVSDGKPANQAGIEAGDIIIQMGDFVIDDIYAYMGALSKFQKGEKVEVKFVRGDEEMTTTVEF